MPFNYRSVKLGAGSRNRTGLLLLGRQVGYHSLTRMYSYLYLTFPLDTVIVKIFCMGGVELTLSVLECVFIVSHHDHFNWIKFDLLVWHRDESRLLESFLRELLSVAVWFIVHDVFEFFTSQYKVPLCSTMVLYTDSIRMSTGCLLVTTFPATMLRLVSKDGRHVQYLCPSVEQTASADGVRCFLHNAWFS